MLQQIRPYCGIVVYLLIVSYVGIIGKQTLCNVYYSVAYTAKVLNANAGFWQASEGHHHSQEIALQELLSFQESQQEDSSGDNALNVEEPNQKLKFFNDLNRTAFEVSMIYRPNFSSSTFKSGLFCAINSPPPQS